MFSRKISASLPASLNALLICSLAVSLFCLTSAMAFSQGTGKSEASSGKKSEGSGSEKTGDSNAVSSSQTPNLDELKVSLNSENELLSEALFKLLKPAKISFVVDDSLKNARVSAQVKQTTLKKALELLLKVSTLPIEWDKTDDIYHFKLAEPKAESKSEKKSDASEEAKAEKNRTDKIKLKNSDPNDVLDKLLGRDQNLPQVPRYQFEIGGGSARTQFTHFVNGRLVTGSATSDQNGSRGGTRQSNLFDLIGRLIRFRP